jgi:hypothetical protein
MAMNCPRCGADISEGTPCPKCGARVTHLRFGSDPDYTNVRRVRIDTPPGTRHLADGLPRLRRGDSGDPATRFRFYVVVGGGVLLVAIAAAIFAGVADDEGGAGGPGPSAPADAAIPDAAVFPHRSLLPGDPVVVLPVPGLPPTAPPDASGVAPIPPNPPVSPSTTPVPSNVGVPTVAIPLPPAPIPVAPVVANPSAVPGLPGIPAAVQQIAVAPSATAVTNCSPTPCRVEERGWTVADRARDLLDTDPALAACWAEETVRQGRKFNVPAMASSGYFHLGLAYREMGCRERAYGAFLSSLCEGRASVRPSLLEGYLGHCRRLGDGCDQPCRDERYIVSDQPSFVPPPAPPPAPAPAPAAPTADPAPPTAP